MFLFNSGERVALPAVQIDEVIPFHFWNNNGWRSMVVNVMSRFDAELDTGKLQGGLVRQLQRNCRRELGVRLRLIIKL